MAFFGLAKFISNRIQKTKNQSFTSTVSKIGIGSITIGLVVMILSYAILLGFKRTIKDKLFSLSSHIQVSKITLNQSFEETPTELNTDFYRNYRRNAEIRHVQGIANKAGMLKSETELSGVVIKGVGKDYDWKTFNENLVEGRSIRFNDTTYSNEVIISKVLANKLKLAVNNDVIIYFIQNPPKIRKLKVVGIYETGLEEFDKSFIIGDLALIQKINDWNNHTVGHLEIFVKDFDKLENVYDLVLEQIDTTQQAVKVTEMYPQIFDWLQLLDRNIVIVLVLILIVASFNMISVLLVMMMERTPMIGLLKSMGADNYLIRKVFIFNGLDIILKGLIFGNIIGIGLCAIQYFYKIIPLDPESYYMNYVPIEWNWLNILMLNILTVVMVVLAISIPTYIISRMKIVDALKFKE